MRLLHVCHQYWPAVGGAERYITELSEEMAARGHQVDVYTTRSDDYMKWNKALPSRQLVRGVRIRRFPSISRRRHTWQALDLGLRGYARTRKKRFEPFVLYGNGPLSPSMAAGLMRRVHTYDLVHIASLHYAHAWTAFKAAAMRGVPVALTPLVHMDQPDTYDVGYMRRILHDSQVVFAVTEAEQRFLTDQSLSANAVVSGSGLHIKDFPSIDRTAARERFGLPHDAFVALFLGRKTAYKGLEVCLAAHAALRSRRPNATLLAVGLETEYSHRLWSSHPLTNGVVIRGEVSDVDRLAALAACDVLVLPSAGESFGIVYLEAWAYAKPVIGANISAVATLIDHGTNGYLIEPGDAVQLAQRLNSLAADPVTARQLGENGRRKLVTRYTWQRIGDIVEGAYVRVLRHHTKQRGVAACA